MLEQHVERGRRRHGRLHRGAARRGERLRRDARRRRATASSTFLEKPADPPGMPGPARHARWPAWASTCSRREFLFEQLRRDADDPHSSHDFGKDIIPAPGQARQSRRAPLRQLVRARRRRDARPTGATSARSTPTGRPTSTSPTSCRRSTCTTRTGRSGPTPRSRRRPSSSTTRTAGAAWRPARWSRAAASSPAPRSTSRCCSPACTRTPTAMLDHVVALPYVQIGRGARLQQGGDRPRRRDPGRASWSARIPSSTPSASAAPTTASA